MSREVSERHSVIPAVQRDTETERQRQRQTDRQTERNSDIQTQTERKRNKQIRKEETQSHRGFPYTPCSAETAEGGGIMTCTAKPCFIR